MEHKWIRFWSYLEWFFFFAISQLWTFSKSWLRCNWILSALSPAYVRWLSSAYILGAQFDRQFGRSLIYNRNSSDPKIVPWGTPQLNDQLLESDALMEHIRVRFSKYDWNHLCAFPYMLWSLNFDKRISWSAVSKAFFRSKKTTALILPRATLYAQVSVASRRAETVECIARKPDWYL